MQIGVQIRISLLKTIIQIEISQLRNKDLEGENINH